MLDMDTTLRRHYYNRLTANQWFSLLDSNPEHGKHIPINGTGIRGSKWLKLLKKHPTLERYCDWERLEDRHWRVLITEDHRFAKYCDWEKLSGETWSLIIANHPQFAAYCDWEKLNTANWCNLIRLRPQFASACNHWALMSNTQWSQLIQLQPQFQEICDVVDAEDHHLIPLILLKFELKYN